MILLLGANGVYVVTYRYFCDRLRIFVTQDVTCYHRCSFTLKEILEDFVPNYNE